MNFKPDEKDWIAYLYGELGEDANEKFEQYLQENPDARHELERYKSLRKILSAVQDKEVIAPPILLGDHKQSLFRAAPYFKTIISIAASLLIIMIVGRLTGTSVSLTNQELRISFGKSQELQKAPATENQPLSADEVRQMIRASIETNNNALAANWKENEEKLTSSVRKNLDMNSKRISQLVMLASQASQDQIRSYVSGLQNENMQMVKDYFALSTAEQKSYIENLLVDFSEYLQQQRNNDLQLVQMRMNSLEQNTDIFKQETEQILSSLITTVGTPADNEIKN